MSAPERNDDFLFQIEAILNEDIIQSLIDATDSIIADAKIAQDAVKPASPTCHTPDKFLNL